ncbi:MAG: isoprenylcysteine carboxylmethyltransferase family protein [Alphaproteobacteria bacterium]|nr:isoprenylcysteine carboxylmethyltransferase family protein [Alphaproteobacteria bacterium]MBL7096147.1 isoprenylcysteine carboxylmethyltransferase family protein [Alphaproteobacteria bacterium]
MRPDEAIYLPWGAWAVSWCVAALWANRTVSTPGARSQLRYRLLAFAGFVLLLANAMRPYDHGFQQARLGTLWSLPSGAQWAMVWLATLGFAFCWWARIHLGALWSSAITRKEGHHVVDTGPYALVRHPIYTGLLTAAFATMMVRGTSYAVAGFALLVAAYVMKGRMEEGFLRVELGAEAYDAYARKTAMLVPFLRL